MAGVGCVMVSSIPKRLQKTDIQVHFEQPENGGGATEFILYPLGNDRSLAVIKFKEDKVAESVIQASQQLHGHFLHVAPLPRQVFGMCQADVDPVIVASIPDLVSCIDKLRNDFGVQVHYDSVLRRLTMAGSFLQLQFAQAALNTIYKQQEELHQRRLVEAADKALTILPTDHTSYHTQPRTAEELESAQSTKEDISLEALSFKGLPSGTYNTEGLRTSVPAAETARQAELSNTSLDVSHRSVKDIISECLQERASPSSSFVTESSEGHSRARGQQPKSLAAELNTSGHSSLKSELEESSFSRNAKTVDEIFRSTEISKKVKSGPKTSGPFYLGETGIDRDLTDSWGSMTQGTSTSKVILNFDTQIFNYMRKIEGQRLKELERSYHVQLLYRKQNEVTMVCILPVDETSTISANLAKNPLLSLYQSVSYQVTKELVSLESLSSKKRHLLEKIISQVKDDYKGKVLVDYKGGMQLSLVGEREFIPEACDYIRGMLGLKKTKTETDLKPKLVFMMQSPKPIMGSMKEPSKTSSKRGVQQKASGKSQSSHQKSPKESLRESKSRMRTSSNSTRVSVDSNRSPSQSMTSSTRRVIRPQSTQTFTSTPRSSIAMSPLADSFPITPSQTPKTGSRVPPDQSPRCSTPSELSQSALTSSSLVVSRKDLHLREVKPQHSPRASDKFLEGGHHQSMSRQFSPESPTGSLKDSKRIQSSTDALESHRESIPSQRGSQRHCAVNSPRSQNDDGRSSGNHDTSSQGFQPLDSLDFPGLQSPRAAWETPQASPAGHGAQEPSQADPGEMQPRTLIPGEPQPGPVGPGHVHPRTFDPGEVHPKPVGPGEVEPSPVSTQETSYNHSSMQQSVQTSITGVTPLSSVQFSMEELMSLSYQTSLDFGLSQGAASMGAGTMTRSRQLTNVGFSSSADLIGNKEFGEAELKQDVPTFKFVTKEGMKVVVSSGDLSLMSTDVIVCPAREDLHMLHGVAGAVSAAAGHELQEQATQHIIKHGFMKVSEVFTQPTVGRLRAQYVIQAVGPMWCLYPDKAECETVLKQTFLTCLNTANQSLHVSSIAMPAVGTGDLGVPSDVCAWALLAAIEEFSSTDFSTRSLQEVYLVNSDVRVTNIIGETLGEVLAEQHSVPSSPVVRSCGEKVHDSTEQPYAPKKELPLLVRLVAACVKISERAGAIIRDILQGGDLGIVDKGMNDLQTEADRAAQRCIVASLDAQFPGIVTVGEEGESASRDMINPDWIEMGQSEEVLQKGTELDKDLQDVKLDDIVVWIDPVDGTSEFTQGLLDHVTTLIGVCVCGRALGGVIHQPFYNYQAPAAVPRGRNIWGIIGLGAFGFESQVQLDDENIIVTTRSHGTGAVAEAVEACKPTEVLRVGGCGHKVVLLLEGKAQAYVFASPGCKKWDTAAPEAVLHAAGGVLTDIHGHHLKYDADVQRRNSAGVLATPPGGSHQWYLGQIPESVKDALPVVTRLPKLSDPMHSLMTVEDVEDTNTNHPLLVQLVAACVKISERAAAIIRDILQGGDLGIVDKGMNDLQTEADRAAQRCIVASLDAQFPGIVTVGEEGESASRDMINPDWIEMGQSEEVLQKGTELDKDLQNVKLDDIVVWIDPVDGTSEFTQGLLDHVTTLIGVCVCGRALGGVIHQPFYNYQAPAAVPRGRNIWGIIGLGAFGFESQVQLDDENIIVTTRSHGTGAVAEAVEACKPTEVLRVGGCGHKVVLLLEGKAQAYVFASPGCKKWDTAAPEAVLHAAGGVLTDIHGHHLKYDADVQRRNSAGVLATPPGGSHQWYLGQIPESVKETLPTVADSPTLKMPMHVVTPLPKASLESFSVSDLGASQEPTAFGRQPKDGTMQVQVNRKLCLPGFPDVGAIVIEYIFPSGRQLADGPQPGAPYSGATFVAYLPNNLEGRQLQHMLRQAFDSGWTFILKRQVGQEDLCEITWADVPHKTEIASTVSEDGYPDDEYMTTVRELLIQRGIQLPPLVKFDV